MTNTSRHDLNGSTGNIKGFSYSHNYDVRDESGNVLLQKQIDVTHQSSEHIMTLKPG